MVRKACIAEHPTDRVGWNDHQKAAAMTEFEMIGRMEADSSNSVAAEAAEAELALRCQPSRDRPGSTPKPSRVQPMRGCWGG